MKTAPESAFPHEGLQDHRNLIFYPESTGMTLRDYFASKAMESYVFPEMLHEALNEEEIVREFQNVAAFSYRMADAMLTERSKP